MKEKLKAFLIHALGGCTKQEMEKRDEEHRREIARWRLRCNEMVNEYGRIETIIARRTIDAHTLHEYEWKICDDMLKELFDVIRRTAGRLVEKHQCDDYERAMRTVTMSIRLIRNEHF
ncbi:MAG: hypothetical protein E7316_02340 [Clostridiales bacterium]|nr:hypothetical protein [Clostridiales bacterium]